MSEHKHTFIPSEIYKDYEFCVECDTYHSLALMGREKLYENDYWEEKNGHSFWGDQINNLTLDEVVGFSKVNKVLSYVETAKKYNILELGCAPGVILNRLNRLGHNVYGIEPDAKYIPEIIKVCGLPEERILHGYFPEIKLPDIKFDYIIAMDLVEHIEDYKTFINSVYDNLGYLGKFIMMSPIIYQGQFRERDLCAHEHAWVFGYDYFAPYLASIFQEVLFDRWREGHEMFICKRIKK